MSEKKSKYYPVFWNLAGKRCVVIGGGNIATRKVKDLLAAGAQVCLVSPEVGRTLSALIEAGKVKYLGARYLREYLEDARLVIGATSDKDLNRQIAADAAAMHIPVNIVDVPELCDFIVPASVKRGALTIAVSTSGASPALAKKIREELETIYGEEYAMFLAVLQQVREVVLARGAKETENKKIFTALVDSALLQALKDNDVPRAEAIVQEITGEAITIEL